MLYGIPEEEGLRCPLHGWLFNETGQCIEMPGEPPGSTFPSRVQIEGYPVQELAGLIFAYLEPEPVPAWNSRPAPGSRPARPLIDLEPHFSSVTSFVIPTGSIAYGDLDLWAMASLLSFLYKIIELAPVLSDLPLIT